MNYTLYTIGRGDLSPHELIERLHQFNVTTLVDLRHAPIEQANLESHFPEHGITYRNASAYLGKNIERTSTEYVMGIARLLNLVALENDTFVAVMDAETEPFQSYRHRVIARSLIAPAWSVIEGALDLTIIHIDENGQALAPLDATIFE